MTEGLYGQSEVRSLIESDDVLDGVVECLRYLWDCDEAFDERTLETLEFRTRLVEQTLAAQHDLYGDIKRRVADGEGFSPLDDVDEGCCLIADSLSLREGFQLARDLPAEKGWDVDVEWTVCPALPTGTSYACPAWFGTHAPSAVSRDDYAYIGGENITLPNTNPEYVWARFPDTWLHGAVEGRHVVDPLDEVYDRTKQVLVDVIEQSVHSSAVVASDHGYTTLIGRNPYATPDEVEDIFAEKFDGRYCEVVNSDPLNRLESEGYTERAGGYYMVAGHHSWTHRGKQSKILHGGMSLLECLTPVVRIST